SPAWIALRVPALPGGAVLGRRADGRGAGRRAAAASCAGIPGPVHHKLRWPRQRTAHYASRPGRTSPAWAGDGVAASLLRLVGPGRRCAVLDGAVQAPL